MKKDKKKILVLTDDMPWGHRSIAKAIFKYLKENQSKNNYEVELAEIKAETAFVSDLYTFAYRYIPKTNRMFHRISGTKVAKDILKEMSILNLENLKEKIDEIKPDLVISSYFLHSHSLSRWRKEENKNFKLWSVVTDPWTINALSFVKDADLNIVYDENSLREGQRWGLEKEKMMITGWWTREEMYQEFDRKKTRRSLGFNDDRPVIFVGGGSLGMNSLPKLLPVMLTLKERVGFIVNTGTDKLAFNLIEQFMKILKRLKKENLIQIKHLGWIENMSEVLSAADIVFGKAGPNFLFDCLACKKPFVAMTHIGGQEDGNIDLIKKKKLGWVKEKNGEISNFLYEYLEKPKYFEEKYKGNIKREAENNQKSLGMILNRIKKEFSL
ncbi:MAG: glycosyltransferase [Candidatus Shapirobacteria bacterium]